MAPLSRYYPQDSCLCIYKNICICTSGAFSSFSHDLRAIQDSEIGFALLYMSIDNYCNPRSQEGKQYNLHVHRCILLHPSCYYLQVSLKWQMLCLPPPSHKCPKPSTPPHRIILTNHSIHLLLIPPHLHRLPLSPAS